MDARLREGIRLFNEARFFESHETFERFYQETEEENKAFVEGLIQLAAAFRIYADFGEVRGPVRMIYQALIRLENYQPTYLAIKVQKFGSALEAWANAAQAATGNVPLAIPKIPVQRLTIFS
jgi:predicted metal-dependent hydrolase